MSKGVKARVLALCAAVAPPSIQNQQLMFQKKDSIMTARAPTGVTVLIVVTMR